MSADIAERLRKGVPNFIDTGPGGDLHIRRYDTVAAGHTMSEAAETIVSLRARLAEAERRHATKDTVAAFERLAEHASAWKRRAEAAEAQLAKAREALGRISSNGFGHPLRNLDPKRDKEMLAMMDYARSTLAPAKPAIDPTISDETRAALAEIDEAQRRAARAVSSIVVGGEP